MILFKTIIFLIIVPGTVIIIIPNYLLSLKVNLLFPDIGIFRFLGLIPAFIGAAIILWCFWDFITTGRGTPAPIDPPKKLVKKGLYRLTRNPMYVGAASILIGEILLFGSILLFVYSLSVILLFHLFIIFYEEPTLKRKFGSAYEDYVNSVQRWIPNINSLRKFLKCDKS